MINLRRKGLPIGVHSQLVGRVYQISDEVFQVATQKDYVTANSDAVITLTSRAETGFKWPLIHSITNLPGLEEGDIAHIFPNGNIHTVFRAHSLDNSLFTTDQCNSNCLMCSQPPKKVNDIEYLFDLNCQIIQLMPQTTEIVGVTGGEPTLMKDRLFEMLGLLNDMHPECLVHILSNGRAFASQFFLEQYIDVSRWTHIWGIPLYSDFYADHDYIVQAEGAFNQTVQGIYNLAKVDARIELRVVLHRLSISRLPQLARFISQNLPFVERVAFMGLEYIGYTPFNDQLLWIDPLDYQTVLSEVVELLDINGINVSIYNLPLCLLPAPLRRFATKSISDWKREYLPECNKCILKMDCGGVFGTSKKLSQNIQSIYAA
jgi:His-Xaa-Ser system radical SAM maturase HxsC